DVTPSLSELGATGIDVHAAGQATGALTGQIFFLDLHGASDVQFNGPVTVSGIDVPTFQVPGHIAGQEPAVATSLLASLRQTFANAGVIFTTQQPATGTAFSTIYIGGAGENFAAYGFYLGLSEHVDAGNRDRSDNALVFSQNIVTQPQTPQGYGQALA